MEMLNNNIAKGGIVRTLANEHLDSVYPEGYSKRMESRKRILREYVDRAGRNRFREWIQAIRDIRTQYVIDARLTRIANGNLGDCEPVGDGVMEFRIHYGSGYRIYFAQEGKNMIILLIGGDKKSQRKDIATAKTLWREYQTGSGQE